MVPLILVNPRMDFKSEAKPPSGHQIQLLRNQEQRQRQQLRAACYSNLGEQKLMSNLAGEVHIGLYQEEIAVCRERGQSTLELCLALIQKGR